jgi:hypothetical protein
MMFGSPQPQAQNQQPPFGSSNTNNLTTGAPPQSQPIFGQQTQVSTSSPSAGEVFGSTNQSQSSFSGAINAQNGQNAQNGFNFGNTGTSLGDNTNSKPFFGGSNNGNSQFSFGNASNFSNQAPNSNMNSQNLGSNGNNQPTGNFGFGNNSQTTSNINPGSFSFNTQPQVAKPPSIPAGIDIFANNQAAIINNIQSTVNQQNQASQPSQTNLNRQPQNLFSKNN